jgi:predicted RNA-binding Zn-ribbon protein involved in translation (DUF1610 family)
MNATARVSSGRQTRDYRCEACGYQIAIPQPHPVCPMCGEDFWALIAPARQSWRSNVRAGRAPLVNGLARPNSATAVSLMARLPIPGST